MSATQIHGHEAAARAGAIAADVTAAAADDVDTRSRFPFETFEALQAAGLLGTLIPVEYGGIGATLAEAGDTVTELARMCSSSGMILAMHHLQVACVVRHGQTPALQEFMAEIANEQLLLASATTEVGVGGNTRESICAVMPHETGFQLEKAAGVISYGSYADAVLATARRNADAPKSDQVLVVCRAPGLSLEQTGEWNTLGMRGTCSPGFALRATGSQDMILPVSFGEISERTMLPYSHVLWACVWRGIASAAVEKARAMVRAEARKNVDVLPKGAPALAELVMQQRQLEALVQDALDELDRLDASDREGVPMSFTIAMNTLKVAASRLVVEIVSGALMLCGMAGYAHGTPYSLGRQLRDAYSATVMINNTRLLDANAHMLTISKG
ncbi:MAG TPA: acyl-CoA dehydrogenase family protein [Acidimicrobiales bacterium]|nr:acyl-CoA dehydrogenase family protein [Acidimicrobiales bacterium]